MRFVHFSLLGLASMKMTASSLIPASANWPWSLGFNNATSFLDSSA